MKDCLVIRAYKEFAVIYLREFRAVSIRNNLKYSANKAENS